VEWERFGAFDWGYSKPWAYGLFAVDYEGRVYFYRLLYGCKEGEYDVGTRMTDTDICRAIRDFERTEPKIRWRVADPSIWSKRPSKDGMLGPAPADNMIQEGITFVKADNQRLAGWQQIHHRLRIDDDGQPWLYIHKSLDHAWRTLSLMKESQTNPEDLETKNIEDHIADVLRYAVMTRPIRPKHTAAPDIGSFQYERRKMIRARQMATRYGIGLNTAYSRV
jgi:phage terminase large subunit